MLEPFIQKKTEFLSIEEWKKYSPKVVAGFSTRNGGLSEHPFEHLNLGLHVHDDPNTVISNRRILSEKLGIPLKNWIGSNQIHEATITKVSAKDAGRGIFELESALDGTDGIYTGEENLLLTSIYADCVPLYFLAPRHSFIGLAHAGWRGTVKKIGPLMIRRWKEKENISPEDIYVTIGPCISLEAYEVDESIIKEVNHVWPKGLNFLPYKDSPNNKYKLDLREVNKQLLIESGVKEEHILMSSICTANDPRMFSHRAEHGETGRMMSFLGLFGKESYRDS